MKIITYDWILRNQTFYGAWVYPIDIVLYSVVARVQKIIFDLLQMELFHQ